MSLLSPLTFFCGRMPCVACRQVFTSAGEAMAYYGEKRMKNKKGVTQASQRRWVEYYHQTLASDPPVNLGLQRTLVEVRALLPLTSTSLH